MGVNGVDPLGLASKNDVLESVDAASAQLNTFRNAPSESAQQEYIILLSEAGKVVSEFEEDHQSFFSYYSSADAAAVASYHELPSRIPGFSISNGQINSISAIDNAICNSAYGVLDNIDDQIFVTATIRTGSKTILVGAAIIYTGGAAYALVPVTTTAVGGGYLVYNLGSNISSRVSSGESGLSATGGAVLDLTGIGGVYRGITDTDLTSGIKLNLDSEKRGDELGSGIGSITLLYGAPQIFKAGNESQFITSSRNVFTNGLNRARNGGKTFTQYKKEYWINHEKPTYGTIRLSNGKVFKVYEELHHAYIPQRANWAPNWLKNNRLNLKPLNSIRHGMRDPYRFKFFPKEIKDALNNGDTLGF